MKKTLVMTFIGVLLATGQTVAETYKYSVSDNGIIKSKCQTKGVSVRSKLRLTWQRRNGNASVIKLKGKLCTTSFGIQKFKQAPPVPSFMMDMDALNKFKIGRVKTLKNVSFPGHSGKVNIIVKRLSNSTQKIKRTRLKTKRFKVSWVSAKSSKEHIVRPVELSFTDLKSFQDTFKTSTPVIPLVSLTLSQRKPLVGKITIKGTFKLIE